MKLDCQLKGPLVRQQMTNGHMRAIGRLAESEDSVVFARFDEFEKCAFIKANAPVEAWSSTDDGLGLLVKAGALREQAREALVSTARFKTSSLPRSPHLLQLSPHPCACWI